MKQCLLIFLFVFCGLSAVIAQHASSILGKSMIELQQPILFSLTPSPLLLKAYTLSLSSRSIMLQPQQYWSYKEDYCDELGFFCKMELKREAKAKRPVKFRLGDVQYVDRLEGKRQ